MKYSVNEMKHIHSQDNWTESEEKKEIVLLKYCIESKETSEQQTITPYKTQK